MKRILLAMTSVFSTCFFAAVSANPIVAPGGFNPGQVNIQQNGSNLIINQSSHTTNIRWNQFNIGKGETTTFNQPSRSSVAINRINSANGGSQIYGTLNANGRIILINQAGIYFGPGSFVNVGSIIASTSDMSKFNEKKYVFDLPSNNPNAAIINRGTINAADYGLVALIGNRVENNGNITAHAGTVVMGAGNKFTLDFVGDQLLNFSIDEASSNNNNTASDLKNLGTVHINAGVAQKILDHAINTKHAPEATRFAKASNGDLIFSDGTIDVSGNKAGQQGGKVKLLATRVKVKNATINASGDTGGGEVLIGGNYKGQGPEFNATSTFVDAKTTIKADAIRSGNGGKVIVWANEDTGFHGNISAQGGALSGNGGFVETSGHQYLDIANAKVNTLAANGDTGTWLLDPENVTIQNNGGINSNSSYNSSTGTYSPTGDSSIIDVGNLQTALGTTNIIITTGLTGSQAGDITVLDPVTWSTSNSLTLSAYRNILLNNNLTSTGAATINLIADNSGTGTGTITGSGVITTAAGGAANFYYNPTSYATPTNFSANIANPVNTALMSYMLVNDVTQLQSISSYLNDNFALGKDIDASITSTWNAGAGFLPIGTAGTPFTGSLDGLNHVIDGLYINRPTLENVGLFGVINLPGNNAISNLGLTNVNITGAGTDPNYLGALAGVMNNGTISNVFATGSVTQPSSATCSFGCSVGGLIGGLNNGTITKSYNAATVTSMSPFSHSTGGLVGYVDGGSIINLSYNSGTVTGYSAGGLVGGIGSGNIFNSYNTGAVFGTNRAGGLTSLSNFGSITNSYASGLVSSSGIAGGLIAVDGGFGMVVTNSYWDTDTTGQLTSAGGTPMTTAQMMQQSSYTGWNFTTIWGIIENKSYPYLLNFYPTTPRVISGIIPGNTTGNNGIVTLAVNGVNVDSTHLGDNGFFYFLTKNNTIADGAPMLVYRTDGIKSNAIALAEAGGNSSTNLVISPNTVTIGNNSVNTYSNTTLGQAVGSLNVGNDNILYSVSGTDLTLGNATSPSVTLSSTANTTYHVNGNIYQFAGTIGNSLFHGITNFGGSVNNLTGTQTFNGQLLLSHNATFLGNTIFNNNVDGNFDLILSSGGSINGTVGSTTPLLSLTANGPITLNNTIHTTQNQNYTNTVTLGSNTQATSDTGNISLTNGIVGGGFNLGLSAKNITIGGSLSNLNSITTTGTSGDNTLTLATNDAQHWSVAGVNSGSISNIAGVTNPITFSNIQNLIGGSSGANSLTTSNGANTWTITGANSGTVTGLSGGFQNIQNITAGTGTNNFSFGPGSIINGIIDGGTGGNSTIDFSAYGQALNLVLTSNSAGNLDLSGSPIASFINFNTIIGPINSSITLPNLGTPNSLIFKPGNASPFLAQLNKTFNFYFNQFTNIYGYAIDTVDLRNVFVHNPSAQFSGNSIMFTISDPVNVTFTNISNFLISDNSINAGEALTQGVASGDDALARAPSNTNTNNSSTASMLTTATQAIDTAFGETKVSNENASGGCGGNVSTSAVK